jgi:hypothetical protein
MLLFDPCDDATLTPCVGCETVTPHRCARTRVGVCDDCRDWWEARLARTPAPRPVASDVAACVRCGELTRLREASLEEPCCLDCQRRAVDAAADRFFGGDA